MRVLLLRSAPEVELLHPAARVVEQRQAVEQGRAEDPRLPGLERLAGPEPGEEPPPPPRR